MAEPEAPDGADDEQGAAGLVGLELDWRELSPEALRGLVESFVHREGTDYGAVERDLESKVEDVMRQLRRGEAQVVFDPESESATLLPIPGGRRRST